MPSPRLPLPTVAAVASVVAAVVSLTVAGGLLAPADAVPAPNPPVLIPVASAADRVGDHLKSPRAEASPFGDILSARVDYQPTPGIYRYTVNVSKLPYLKAHPGRDVIFTVINRPDRDHVPTPPDTDGIPVPADGPLGSDGPVGAAVGPVVGPVVDAASGAADEAAQTASGLLAETITGLIGGLLPGAPPAPVTYDRNFTRYGPNTSLSYPSGTYTCGIPGTPSQVAYQRQTQTLVAEIPETCFERTGSIGKVVLVVSVGEAGGFAYSPKASFDRVTIDVSGSLMAALTAAPQGPLSDGPASGDPSGGPALPLPASSQVPGQVPSQAPTGLPSGFPSSLPTSLPTALPTSPAASLLVPGSSSTPPSTSPTPGLPGPSRLLPGLGLRLSSSVRDALIPFRFAR